MSCFLECGRVMLIDVLIHLVVAAVELFARCALTRTAIRNHFRADFVTAFYIDKLFSPLALVLTHTI